MKHYGDITKLNGAGLPIVDVITGGSPCQDLSVAGKRAGLAGERSGLFMEQIRLIKEMREHDRAIRGTDVDIRLLRPRYMVWENVCGAFSSNKGEDFRAVLEETAKVADETAVIPEPPGGKWQPAGCIMGKGWSIAWRVHDAQFWGVPQRRKRIALVADFGGESAPEILFEREGLSGDTSESGEEGKDATSDAGSGIEETGGAIGFHLTQDPVSSDELSYACSCGNSQSGQCVNGVVYGIGGYNSKGMLSNNPKSGIYEADTSRTLDNNAGNPSCNQGGMAVVSIVTKQLSQNIGDNVAMTICANDYKEPQVVSYGLDRASFNQGENAKFNFSIEEEKIGAQVARGPGAVLSVAAVDALNGTGKTVGGTLCANARKSLNSGNVCRVESIVRRLTPMECERLQGYPDHWTDIGDWVDSKGKTHKGESDSPRYKALGNSIALPFWQWMAERMIGELKKGAESPTMASLFDGISGFCLVYARAGCKPIWSSEIEEYPIAVATKHFGDEDKEIIGDYEQYLQMERESNFS